MSKTLYLLIFLFPIMAFAHEEWESNSWLKLGHYKQNIFGAYNSKIDGESFFLASNGKKNPYQEWQVTRELFLKEVKNKKLDKMCRFPARFFYFARLYKLDIKNLLTICSKWQEYLTYLQSDAVSVVFSSYYTGSSASMFGHTLLRFHKSGSGESALSELLDIGANFAADQTTDNPLLYTYLGLTGGFKGVFKVLPYYYKIREYNDFESRDLWSYELNLSKDELLFLKAHLFELGQTYIDYYYLTENCSYHLIGLLDAVKPDLNLKDKLAKFVIPIDTIKALLKVKGLIRNISFRPSSETKFRAAYESLSKAEQKIFLEQIKEINIKKLLALDKSSLKRNVLDALIDFYDFYYGEDILKEQGRAHLEKYELLASRSTILEKKSEVKKTRALAPHLSHGSRRLGISGINDRGKGLMGIDFRFAMHDLQDPKTGMDPNAKIEMMHLNSYYDLEKQEFRVQSLSLASVDIFRPFKPWQKTYGLKVDLGLKQYDKDRAAGLINCSQCLRPTLLLSPNLSFEILGRVRALYGIGLDLETMVGQKLHRTWINIEYGPSIFSYFYYKRFNLRANWSSLWSPTQKNNHYAQLDIEARYHYRINQSIQSFWQMDGDAKSKIGLGYLYYF